MFDAALNENLNSDASGNRREANDCVPHKLRWWEGMQPSPELKAKVERIAEKTGCPVRAVLWQLIRTGLADYRQAHQRTPQSTVTIGLFLDQGVHAQLIDRTKTERRSVEDIIRGAVDEFLAKANP